MTQVCNNQITPKKALKIKKNLDQSLNCDFFKALSDPTRLKLLSCLTKCSRPCTLSEIAECCSVDLSVVSRHMLTLHKADLVTTNKIGRSVYYQSNPIVLAEKFEKIAKSFLTCCSDQENCCE
jgi:DNA-binding transcriptional ArsR family regulator